VLGNNAVLTEDREAQMTSVGIIGLGRSGWELHAEPLHRMSGYGVTAVCDQSGKRLARAADELSARAYDDAQDLIEDPDVDLVVVAVPGNLHASLTIAALNGGKHVVVEKPMAGTIEEADAMLAAAERNKRLLVAFHNRHWDEDYRMLKALVRRGELGELLNMDSRIMSFGAEWASYGVPEFNPTWRVQAAYGGGFLADWGPHMVEQCLDLIGEWPTTVTCQLRSHMWSTEVDDYFNVRLSFGSGLLVTLEGSNNARIPPPRWFAVGREGTLISGSGWSGWTDMRLMRGTEENEAQIRPDEILPREVSAEANIGDDLSAFFYADLAHALQEGRPPTVAAERARDVVAILEAARRSNDAGHSVEPDGPKSIRARAGSE